MIRINPVTVNLTSLNEAPVRVHLFSTGVVAVKQRFRDARLSGIPAQLQFLLSSAFTEWMPIWVYVIEHAEGLFVVDTGENSRVNDPGYFAPAGRFENWLNTTQFRFHVDREEEIDKQMEAAGLSLESATVVMTHLHLDHVDGLHHFRDNRVLVHRLEWEKPFGDLPHLYPEGFSPELVDMSGTIGPFDGAHFLSEANDLAMIHTPGHTHGHCSVALRCREGVLFMAGDVSYNQEQVEEDHYSAAEVSRKAAKMSYARVRQWAREENLIYLPSHDAGNAERLEQLQYFRG